MGGRPLLQKLPPPLYTFGGIIVTIIIFRVQGKKGMLSKSFQIISEVYKGLERLLKSSPKKEKEKKREKKRKERETESSGDITLTVTRHSQ